MAQLERILAICVALLLAGCASISRPTVTQLTLTEPQLFMVAYPLRYSQDDRAHEIVVPVGFVTDLASIPKWLWWWQSPHEATMAPAIIHAYLYWEQSCTKDEADVVMYLAMEELSVKGIDAVYAGVRTEIAAAAWKKNAESRKRGETRFLTQSYADRVMRSRANPAMTWELVQSDAKKYSGLYTPKLPNIAVKNACAAAYRYFHSRPKKPMSPHEVHPFAQLISHDR